MMTSHPQTMSHVNHTARMVMTSHQTHTDEPFFVSQMHWWIDLASLRPHIWGTAHRVFPGLVGSLSANDTLHDTSPFAEEAGSLPFYSPFSSWACCRFSKGPLLALRHICLFNWLHYPLPSTPAPCSIALSQLTFPHIGWCGVFYLTYSLFRRFNIFASLSRRAVLVERWLL